MQLLRIYHFLKVNAGQVTFSTKTALDGSSQEIKTEASFKVRYIPVVASGSYFQNLQTGDDKSKIKVGMGTTSNNLFGQAEKVNTQGQTKFNVSVGVQEKTGNTKRTIFIGKSF